VPAPPLLLIVDDEVTYLEVLAEFFQEHGYRVITSASAGDGLQKAVLLTPSVILMDVMMPGLTGWAALSQLKDDPRTRDIPVVMMTGRIIDTSDPAGPHHAAAALLIKPSTPAAIIETVDRALRRPATSS
jgi:CheY-like chemotaxis protein